MQSRGYPFFAGVAALVLLAAVPCVAAEPPDDYGTYRFADGGCVTGGRFDESGKQRLLLMDVVGNRRGGLFEGEHGHFASVIDPASKLAFDAGRERLSWITATGTETARRIHAPRSVAVMIDNQGVSLAGTLYLPQKASRQPVSGIVLAHGSGPQDRYAGTWTTFFVDLGFAVLAYDKRGVGGSHGEFERADFDDMASDLSAAVTWLAARPEVDARRVGIHASSQSGWFSPAVAAGNDKVAFLIERAAPSLPVGPTTLHENVEEWQAAGLNGDALDGASALWRALMDAAAAGRPRIVAQALLQDARGEPWFATAFEGWDDIKPQWWRQQQANARYDPVEDLKRRPVPTLWFLADHDENVPYAASAAALRRAELPANELTLVTLVGAAHSFLVTGDDNSVRYTDDYWPKMATWLRAHGFSGPATPAAQCMVVPVTKVQKH